MPTDIAASPDSITTPRRRSLHVVVLSMIFVLVGCGGEGLIAGGEYSGVPDTPLTAGAAETFAVGQIRNDGTIILNRDSGNYAPFPRR